MPAIFKGLRVQPHSIKLSGYAKEGESQFLELEKKPYGDFITVTIDGKAILVKAITLLNAVATLND